MNTLCSFIPDFISRSIPPSGMPVVDCFHIILMYFSFVDDFTIPELPSGQRLVINILTTWGDQYYVGLNGIEVFNCLGKPVQISEVSVTL